MNIDVAGAFRVLISAFALAPRCENCRGRDAAHAVGMQDHQLVCDPCLSHGDRRRWWNLLPRQVL